MKRMIVLCVAAAVGAGAACGGGARPASIAGGGAVTGTAMADPEAVLRALADAARRDDGKALDALVHPEYGLVLWDQPGATISPTLTLRAGTGEPPSKRLAASGMNEYWLENYWPEVVAGIDGGLARLDREPADRRAAVYGDCGAEDDGGPEPRAWLVSSDAFGDTVQMLLEEAQLRLDPKMRTELVHFHKWGLDAWLARADGRLWVAHLMVYTPCDA